MQFTIIQKHGDSRVGYNIISGNQRHEPVTAALPPKPVLSEQYIQKADARRKQLEEHGIDNTRAMETGLLQMPIKYQR